MAPPISEGFQSDTFPSPGWILNNPNNYAYVWSLNTTVGGYSKSTSSMYFNNKVTANITGERQQMFTPSIDFSSVPNPKIWFDVAYAPYNSTLSDTLAVYYSLDCGKTFTQVYLKGGMTLCTAGESVSNGAHTLKNVFYPLSSNWRTDTIDLSNLSGNNNVLISFENRSGKGEPMYIDNIDINYIPTGIASVANPNSFIVYPNPSNGQFIFESGNTNTKSLLKIYNILGQEVMNTYIESGKTTVNLSSQSKGIYLYRIFTESGVSVSNGRLVVD
jgi:hypothetical protein